MVLRNANVVVITPYVFLSDSDITKLSIIIWYIFFLKKI